MGLLSRTKKPTPSVTPPPISAPLSQPTLPPVPGEYASKYSQSNNYNNGYGGNDKYSSNGHLRAEAGYGGGGALPSPPGSPVEAQGRGYPHHKPPSPSYQNSTHPRPQQIPHSRNGNPVTPTSATFAGASSNRRSKDGLSRSSSRPDTREGQRTNPSSFSSEHSTHSNVLYNDSVGGHSSSPATVGSERDVEGRLESLGLNGQQAANGHVPKKKSVDRTSCQSVEMADGTGDHNARGPFRPAQQQQQQQHQQQQQPAQRPPTSSATQQRAPTTASYNAGPQAPQRQPVSTPTQNGSRPMSSATNNSSILSPTPSQASSIARKTSSRYNLADFTFIRTLGTGSFGRVHLVRSQHNSRSYAVKVLSKERVVKMKQVEHTNSEREMLERVRHPFLVNLWGTFKDAKNLYMVMDFVAGGELFSLLRKSQRFPDPVAKFFAAEVALALDYLHSLDIIYRDLKPENILLGADGHVKITDFGFAKHVPDITWTLCGTPDYLAPEIVQSRGYNKSVDWYALGVLMFEMLAGYPPFFTEDANPMRLYEKIIAGKVRYPSYFAPEAKDLLKSLLTPDLTKRYGNLAAGSRDIFGHSWFQEVDWERLYRKEIPAPYVPKVEGDWDASNFDAYPENDLAEYGSTGPDPHGHLFTAF